MAPNFFSLSIDNLGPRNEKGEDNDCFVLPGLIPYSNTSSFPFSSSTGNPSPIHYIMSDTAEHPKPLSVMIPGGLRKKRKAESLLQKGKSEKESEDDNSPALTRFFVFTVVEKFHNIAKSQKETEDCDGEDEDITITPASLTPRCRYAFEFISSVSETDKGWNGGGADIHKKMLLLVEKAGYLREELWDLTNDKGITVTGGNQKIYMNTTRFKLFRPFDWGDCVLKFKEHALDKKAAHETLKSELLVAMLQALYEHPHLAESVISSLLLDKGQMDGAFTSFHTAVTDHIKKNPFVSDETLINGAKDKVSTSSSSTETVESNGGEGKKKKAKVKEADTIITSTTADSNSLKQSVLALGVPIIPVKKISFTNSGLTEFVANAVNPKVLGYLEVAVVPNTGQEEVNEFRLAVDSFAKQEKLSDFSKATPDQKKVIGSLTEKVMVAYNDIVALNLSAEQKIKVNKERDDYVSKFLYYCSLIGEAVLKDPILKKGSNGTKLLKFYNSCKDSIKLA